LAVIIFKIGAGTLMVCLKVWNNEARYHFRVKQVKDLQFAFAFRWMRGLMRFRVREQGQ
jgi:hypothetical protein